MVIPVRHSGQLNGLGFGCSTQRENPKAALIIAFNVMSLGKAVLRRVQSLLPCFCFLTISSCAHTGPLDRMKVRELRFLGGKLPGEGETGNGNSS